MEHTNQRELDQASFSETIRDLEAVLRYHFTQPELVLDAMAWIPVRDTSPAAQLSRHLLLEWFGRQIEEALSLDLVLRKSANTDRAGEVLREVRYLSGRESVARQATKLKLEKVIQTVHAFYSVRTRGPFNTDYWHVLCGLYGAMLVDSNEYEQLARSFGWTWGDEYSSFGRPRNPDFLLRTSGLTEKLGFFLTKVVGVEQVVRSMDRANWNKESCSVLCRPSRELPFLVQQIDRLHLREDLLRHARPHREGKKPRGEDLMVVNGLNSYLVRLLWTEGYAAVRQFMEPILRGE